MSVQPLFYDDAFGYVVAILPLQHFQWGQEFCVEFADGRSIKLGQADIGGTLWTKVTNFLSSQAVGEP